MKSLISKDRNNRKLFLNFELQNKVNKLIKNNRNLFPFQKWFLKLVSEKNKKHYRSRLKNRCILTGRGSSISRIYQLSRIQFRELGLQGNITGLQKSSW